MRAAPSVFLLMCLALPAVAAEPRGWGEVRAQATDSLCDALAGSSPGEQQQVTVAGLFASGFEVSVFYDPSAWPCEWDVQPATYLEFPMTVPSLKALQDLLKTDGRAYLAVRGTIFGPTPAADDDLSVPPLVAHLNRLGRLRGYGMGGWLPTKIVVDEILRVRPVPAEVPIAAEFMQPREVGAIPALSHAALPRYPPAARRAGVTGDVVVEVTIIGGQVAAVTIVSGDRMLTPTVLENVWSWRFEGERNATLTSTFTFTLELRKTGADSGDRLELALPRSAKIIAARPAW